MLTSIKQKYYADYMPDGTTQSTETNKPSVASETPTQSSNSTAERKSWISSLFKRKGPVQKIVDQDQEMTRIAAYTEIDAKIAEQTTKNRLGEMQQSLGPDPLKSSDLDKQLQELKKKKGLA